MPPLLTALRPRHWLKNGFVFLPIFFAARFDDVAAWLAVTIVFGIFCAAASATYLVNDLADRSADRKHPTKRLRPIAAGKVSSALAATTALVLLIIAIAGSYALSLALAIITAGYVVLHLAYSYALKHVVIVDLLAIATGFNLRVAAGGIAAGVVVSPWLTALTFLVALLLAAGKRRQELMLVGSAKARDVLSEYDLAFLDRVIGLLLPTILAAYLIYSFQPEHPVGLLYSVVPAVYGLLRYAWLLNSKLKVDGPTELLLADRPLQLAAIVWGIVVFMALV